jgi:hypothetical protein
MNGCKAQHHIPSVYPFKRSKNIWTCVNRWTPDVFNMSVHILAPNAHEKAKGQQTTIR